MRRRHLLLMSLCCGMVLAAAHAQGPPSGSDPSNSELGVQLSLAVDDDFRDDSRGSYEIDGPVEWLPGRVSIGNGATITRAVSSGAFLQVQLMWETAPARQDDKTGARLRFDLQQATDWFVDWSQDERDGHVKTTVRILDTVPLKDGKLRPVIVRQREFLGGVSGGWMIRYHYGLIQVRRVDAEKTLTGYISNRSAPIDAIKVSGKGRPSLTKFIVHRSMRPKWTADQLKSLKEATSGRRQVRQLMRRGKVAEAVDLAEGVLAIQRDVLGERHPEFATSLSDVAAVYRAVGSFAKARPYYLQSLKVTRRVLGEDHPSYATSLNNLGLLHMSTGDFANAKSVLLQARDIRKVVFGEEHPEYAGSLSNLALLYHRIGDYRRALPLLVEVLDIRRRSLGEDHPDYAASLNNLGGLYQVTGRYLQAEPLYREASLLRLKLFGADHPNYAESLNNLAGLYLTMGEYAKAEPLFLKARDIWEARLGRTHPRFAASLNNLAMLYEEMAEYGRAEPYYIQARDAFEKIYGRRHVNFATSLNNLAGLYRDRGDYVAAEPLFLEANAILEERLGESHPSYATGLGNLATLYQYMNEPRKAEQLLVRALDIRRDALGKTHPDYASSLVNLANLHHTTGDSRSAERLLLEAREIRRGLLGEDHPDFANCLNTLAVVYQSMGKIRQADELFARASDIFRVAYGDQHPDYFSTLRNLALCRYRQGNSDSAVELLSQSLNAEVRHLDSTLPWLTDAAAFSLLHRQGGVDPWLSVARGRADVSSTEAWERVWMARGLFSRVLQERRSMMVGSAKVAPIVAALKLAQRRLSKLTLSTSSREEFASRQSQLTALSEDKERLERQLASASAEFRRARSLDGVRPTDIVGKMPAGSALVNFAEVVVYRIPNDSESPVGWERHYDAFVAKRGNANAKSEQVVWIRLGPIEPINDALKKWRKGLVAPVEPSHEKSAANRLRQLVWSKIEPHVKGCQHIVVIPDADLNSLPWGALPGAAPGSCLLEEYAFSTINHGAELHALLEESTATSETVLVAGGIDYSRRPQGTETKPALTASVNVRSKPAIAQWRDWPSLQGTAKESTQIAALKESTLLQGSTPDERTLRSAMPHAGYIHLATHGFFADSQFRSLFSRPEPFDNVFGQLSQRVTRPDVIFRNPLVLSGVVVAGANGSSSSESPERGTADDGILTAEEVVHLDLRRTRLVTLSACESGLGEHRGGGEGVFGLQRAFHLAGARCVVASLWKVDDGATQTLMLEFYKNLWQRKMGRLEALRQAQLAMLAYYEPEGGGLSRGPGGKRSVDAKALEAARRRRKGKRLDPFYWAAWTLSGDWR